MSKKVAKIPKSTKFEDAMSELEQIVESLESGEQSLEASLTQFERGISLSRFCQQSLNEAELKVKILLDDSDQGDADLKDFDPADSNSTS